MLTPALIDHVQDRNGQVLHQVRQQWEMPAFVKEASVPTDSELQELPPGCFVDPHTRRFPVHTRADTWLSCAYLVKQAASLTSAEHTALQQAIDLWFGKEAADTQDTPNAGGPETKPKLQTLRQDDGKLDPVKIVKAKRTSVNGENMTGGYPAADYQIEQQQQKSAHTIVYAAEGQPGPQVGVAGSADLEKLAADLQLHPEAYSYPVRANVAHQMLKISTLCSTQLPLLTQVFLEKTAGHACGFLDQALAVVDQHDRALPVKARADYSPRLQHLRECLTKTANEDGIVPVLSLKAAATVLDAVDRFNDLHLRYSTGFVPPERALFSFSPAQMNHFKENAVALMNGKYASKEQIASPPVRHFMQSSLGLTADTDDGWIKLAQSLSLRQTSLLWEFLVDAQAVPV